MAMEPNRLNTRTARTDDGGSACLFFHDSYQMWCIRLYKTSDDNNSFDPAAPRDQFIFENYPTALEAFQHYDAAQPAAADRKIEAETAMTEDPAHHLQTTLSDPHDPDRENTAARALVAAEQQNGISEQHWLPAEIVTTEIMTDPETGRRQLRHQVHPVELRWDDGDEGFHLRQQGDTSQGERLGIHADSERKVSDLSDLRIKIPTRNPEDGTRAENTCCPFTLEGWATMRQVCMDADIPRENELKASTTRWAAYVTRMHQCIQDRLRDAQGSTRDAGLDPVITAISLSRVISEQIGPCELPTNVTYDDLCRYALAESLERQLRLFPGGVKPEPPLDLPATIGATIGVEPVTATVGSGAWFRAGVYRTAAGGGPGALDARSNDNLVRMVFEPLTTTPPEELQVAKFTGDEAIHDRVQERLEVIAEESQKTHVADGRVNPGTNPWVDEVLSRLQKAFPDKIYAPDAIDLWRIGGRDGIDILRVRDLAGTTLLTWPAADRRSILEISREGRDYPMIHRAQIATPEEITQLHQRVEERAARTRVGPDETITEPVRLIDTEAVRRTERQRDRDETGWDL